MTELLKTLWVVIPTYNRAKDLLDCIKSLMLASIDPDNIIVVDNHSQDETIPLIKSSYPRVKLIALDQNLGASGASNIGFNTALKAEARYILRLDSDTIVAPDFREPLLKAAEQHPETGVFGPKIYFFDPADVIWSVGADAHPFHFGAVNTHRREKDTPQNSQVREVDYLWGAAMLIKREVLEKTEGFDPDFFVYYEEIDFCRRVKKLGYSLMCVPQSHIWHKVGSAAHNYWTAFHWNQSKMLLFRKHAKNFFHLSILILYAFTYAIFSPIIKGGQSGNRGPLIHALHGLWKGLLQKKRS